MKFSRLHTFTLALAAALFLALIPTAHAQTVPGTVTLTASPTSGKGSVPVTLTWSTTPAAVSCVGSGGSADGAQGWSGSLAASGTFVVPVALINSQTYTVTCTWTSTSAILTWTAPTEYTNGTPLTVASYNVYEGPASPPATMVANVLAGTTTYTATNLPAGTNYFAVTALDGTGVESALSNIASKATTQTESASATVTVTVIPAQPSNLTAQ